MEKVEAARVKEERPKKKKIEFLFLVAIPF